MPIDNLSRPRGLPPVGRREFVETPQRLEALVPSLMKATAIGVDVETEAPPRERQHRIALIQLALDGDAFAIDPLRLPDLSVLRPVFQADTIIKVFVGIGQDRTMLETVGLPLRGVCDIGEVGRSAFGGGFGGLQAIVERAFSVVIDKSLQRSAWLKRPLPPPLLAYAYRDAEVTLAAYRWLAAQFPQIVDLHTTADPDLFIPSSTPEWLKNLLLGKKGENGRDRLDIWDRLQLAGLTIDDHAAEIVAACAAALHELRDPRLRARIINAAADLDLFELAPQIRPSLEALSATERLAAARALGRLLDSDAKADLHRLEELDSVPDVQAAAAQALSLLAEDASKDAAADDSLSLEDPTPQ